MKISNQCARFVSGVKFIRYAAGRKLNSAHISILETLSIQAIWNTLKYQI